MESLRDGCKRERPSASVFSESIGRPSAAERADFSKKRSCNLFLLLADARHDEWLIPAIH